MRCVPVPGGGIAFASVVESVSNRTPIELRGDGSRLVEACSWCNRINIGTYVEIEEAVDRLALLASDRFAITHTLCGDCGESLQRT